MRKTTFLKTMLIALVLMVGSSGAWGQTTIVSDGLNNSSTLFTLSNGAYYTGNSASSDLPASSPFACEGSYSRGISNGSATLTSSNISTLSYTSVNLSFRLASFSIGSGGGVDASDIVTVEVSPNGGTNYYSTLRVLGYSNAYWSYTGGTGQASTSYDGNATPVDFQPTSGGNRTTDGYSTVVITNLPSISNLKIRITLVNNDTKERWTIDDFKITGTFLPSAPSLTPSTTNNDVEHNIDIIFPTNNSWETSITAIKIGSTALTPTSDYEISAGHIILKPSGLNPLLTTAGSKSITVTATGYADATVTQQIDAGAPTKLGIKTQPTAPATNGAVLGTQPAIYIQDQYGNTTTSTANVDAEVAASGTWTLGGTTSVAATAGTATFSGLTASSILPVNGATIKFTCGSLTDITSSAFNLPAVVLANPASFTATTASDSQINLAATANANNDNIVVVYNQNGTFTAPTPGDAPGNAGDTFAGGIIFYKGTAAGLINHTGLAGNTTEYYKAFSFNTDNNFSAGLATSGATMKAEPTNQVTALAKGTVTTSAIPLTWTAAVTGTQAPDGYLVKLNTGTVIDPVDGTDPADITAVTSGEANKKVTGALSTSATSFTGLTAGTVYNYKVYSYTNSGTFINFNTTAAPSVNIATLPNAVTTGAFTATGYATANITWAAATGYDNTNHSTLVFIKAASAITAGTPTSAPSAYTANTAFGQGTAYQNDAAAYCVYNGDGTSVSVTGLAANTTYYVSIYTVVDASNSDATNSYSASNTASGTTNNLSAPSATSATSVGATGFTANWNATDGATSYKLDISKYPLFGISTPTNITEGFSNGTTAPTNWTFTSIGGTYTTSSNYGTASPSLKFDASGDAITTPLLSGSANQLSFWIKGQGTNSSSALLVEGYNGTAWVTIQNITNSIPTTGTTYTFNSSSTPALPNSIIQFRFTYSQGNGNLSFDDVAINYNSLTPSFISGFNELPVVGTSQVVTGLDENTTYYYRVKATDGSTTSSSSNTITATTLAKPAITGTAATSITANSATFNANITSDGGAALTARGFSYNTSTGVALTDNQTVEGGTATGTFAKDFTGLTPNTQYFYKAFATNSVGTTLSSNETSFYTLANVPGTPTVTNVAYTTLDVTLDVNNNPSATTYAIQETTSGKYVQANGSLGASAVYQTAATWGKVSVTGLTENTTYTFGVTAKNGGDIATSQSSTASAKTLVKATVVLADNGTQVTAGNIKQGEEQAITSFKLSVADANATLSNVSILTQGTYVSSDITYFKLLYNSTNDFVTASQIGSSQTSTSQVGSYGDFVSFSSLSTSINKDADAYFWLVVKIADNASTSSNINADAMTAADLTYSAPVNKSGTASAGGLQSIVNSSTGVKDVTTSLKVAVINGRIVFTANANETVEIFDATGKNILKKKTIAGINQVDVSAQGVLFVKVGAQISKVIK